MILIRTPVRISFLGGGTDQSYYYKNDYGCVLGQSIDKYLYVLINKRFDKKIRVGYSKTELVNRVSEIKHNIIRESLEYFKIKNGMDVLVSSDTPDNGTGLGSSSSLAVGLVHALRSLNGAEIDKNQIAIDACKIEIERLKSPIGKQDQYITTLGGLLFLKFQKNENVLVEKIKLNKTTLSEFENNILLFYTGKGRKTNNVLRNPKTTIQSKRDVLDKIKTLAEQGRDHLKIGNLIDFAVLLNRSWELKKILYKKTTNSMIDSIYKKGIDAGAIGGKISGAGNGGFITFYCEPNKQEKVRKSLKDLRELNFSFETSGTKKLSTT